MYQDINQLKRMLAAGQITPDMLSQLSMQGASPSLNQNELAQIVQPQAPSFDQVAQTTPSRGTGYGSNSNGDKFTFNLPTQDAPNIVNGQVQQPGQPQGFPQGSVMGRGSGTMKVIGTGNGVTANLPDEAAHPVILDYTRNPVDIPGAGRARYGKDGNAYIDDGDGNLTKVVLGYDQAGTVALNKANLDRQKTQGEIAHTQEQIRASQVNNPDLMVGQANGLSGDAVLSAVDPGTAGLVKAYAEGRMAFPGGAAMRSPRMMQLLSLVSQYDPTFDATNFNQRNATIKDYATGGKSGQVVGLVNTALHHAGVLSDAIDQLNNPSFMPGVVNPAINLFEQKVLGDTTQGTYKATADALASELRKVYGASGGGGLAELQGWQANFDPNASKQQQMAYLRTGMDLLSGKVEALKENYNRGMGNRANFADLLSSQAKEGLAKLQAKGISPVALDGVQPSTQQAAVPPPEQRVMGQMYDTPKGKLRWVGNGWAAS